jgi:eukaryotic-like serine/threonine-protein kinase
MTSQKALQILRRGKMKNPRKICELAVAIQGELQRSKFLDTACANDSLLRSRVERLIAQKVENEDFQDAKRVTACGNIPLTVDTLSTKEPQESDRLSQRPRDAVMASTASLEMLGKPKHEGSIGTLGHYQIQSIVGAGAFGIVYKAFDELLHRSVAIKCIDATLASKSPPRKRFIREARAMAAINNENVVQVFCVEETPIPHIVMEYVDGLTLQEKLDTDGPLSVNEIIAIGRQIASGLRAAHSQGLVHRDIKPGNILLANNSHLHVKITDFGLVRTVDDASTARSGFIVGTPLYMSPEQALGSTDSLDARSDLFSLGTVLYQMACGRCPFRGSNPFSILKKIIDEEPVRIDLIVPEVPPWLCKVISKLMEKRPESRFQSAEDVATLLTQW